MPRFVKPSVRLRLVFTVYWVLVAYTIAALIWWFIALNRQNDTMTHYKLQQLKKDDPGYPSLQARVNNETYRKTAQYIGEGAIFFLLIVGGAVYIFRAVRRQIRQSQQQQNFMMAITHELKTPIAVAKLNLETLQKRKLDETMQQRLLYNTLQEANRLNALCNNMLLASQIEGGGYTITKEEIDFSVLVLNCVEDFRLRFPERMINSDLQPHRFVIGDMLLLQMAVNNLLDNAVKYSPREMPITVVLQSSGRLLQLQVKDMGKGISDMEKKKVFDKFYRTGNTATKNARGTGLGLYLTKKIMNEQNGNISVTDNAPTGSIFTLSLPSLQ
jgi:two-component system, OmpR family, sensor histidine kinase CiaH